MVTYRVPASLIGITTTHVESKAPEVEAEVREAWEAWEAWEVLLFCTGVERAHLFPIDPGERTRCPAWPFGFIARSFARSQPVGSAPSSQFMFLRSEAQGSLLSAAHLKEPTCRSAFLRTGYAESAC